MLRVIMAILSVCFVLLCLVLLWGIVERGTTLNKDSEFGYSDLFEKVQSGQILDAVIQGDELRGHLKASPRDQFRTTLPRDHEDLLKAMLAARVTFTIKDPPILVPLLFNVFPYFVLFILTLPPFWTIFKKAGFPAVFSLLMLVPLVNIAVLYVVAFTQWKSGGAVNA
jgi:ATP-dependent Zn protease